MTTDEQAEAAPLVQALRFTRYKSLADLAIALPSRFTLVVGRNASGKSSVLDGFHLLAQLFARSGPWDDHLDGRPGGIFTHSRSVDRLRTVGSTQPLDLCLATKDAAAWCTATVPSTDDVEARSRFVLAIGPSSALRVKHDERTNTAILDSPTDRTKAARFFAAPELRGLGSAVRLRLDAGTAVKASEGEGEQPRVEYTGEGLPAVLAWLAGNDDERFAAISADLARVVHGAGRIRTPRAKVTRTETELVKFGQDVVSRSVRRESWGHVLSIDFAGGSVPGDLLSEGTVLTLAILTVLRSPQCPRIILLDDIERGLHPLAQIELVGCIKELLTANPTLQIVATTHSAHIVNLFAPRDVIVLRADEQGHTHAKPLADHPESARWAGPLLPGEFWSAVGDDWVLG